MKNAAIFFCTDHGYLIPTLVACISLLDQRDVLAVADILVCLIDFTDDEYDRIASAFQTESLKFIRQSSADYKLPIDANYNKTHVPLTALARLTAPRLIPERYDMLLYLDGDVAIERSVLPLLTAPLPPETILAASEHFHLIKGEAGGHAKRIGHYLSRLGISDPADYFNSGVIYASRATWIDLGKKAFAFISERSDLCVYHDQSALNAVSLGRRAHLSPAFNFHGWFQRIGASKIPNPVITHFTGGEKPWNALPGSQYFRYRAPYDDILAKYPFLIELMPVRAKSIVPVRRFRFSFIISAMIDKIRFPMRSLTFSRYMKTTKFIV